MVAADPWRLLPRASNRSRTLDRDPDRKPCHGVVGAWRCPLRLDRTGRVRFDHPTPFGLAELAAARLLVDGDGDAPCDRGPSPAHAADLRHPGPGDLRRAR